MDNLDTVPWLEEGELVLSTGYIFTQTNIHVDIIKKRRQNVSLDIVTSTQVSQNLCVIL